jgi:hypothetical protein
MDHTSRAVLGQTGVDHTPGEIARFQPLLERLDLTSTVVTADALHTQCEHAEWLVTVKQAAYMLVVKANQPTLHQQLKARPWRVVPVADHTRDRGHARVELRNLQVTTIAGLDFPHATQAIRITRRVRSLHGRRWRTVVVYAITTSLPPRPAPRAWPTGSEGTGASRRCTTSAMSPSPRTPARSVPAPPHEPWPACATSPSASCAYTATTTSPPRCAATPATPPDPSHSWASPGHVTDTAALAESLSPDRVWPATEAFALS